MIILDVCFSETPYRNNTFLYISGFPWCRAETTAADGTRYYGSGLYNEYLLDYGDVAPWTSSERVLSFYLINIHKIDLRRSRIRT